MRAYGESLAKLESAGTVIAKRFGERIEYDVGSSQEIQIDSEVQVHLQLKDVFSGEMDETTSSRA